MVQNDLPFNFFCRNARLCIKKAAFSKKANIPADELFQLKSFIGLVTANIKLHPHYEEKKGEKQVIELETYINEARRRVLDLEAKSKTPSPTGGLSPAESPHSSHHALSPNNAATTPKSSSGNSDKSPKQQTSNDFSTEASPISAQRIKNVVDKRNSAKTRLDFDNPVCSNGEGNAKHPLAEDSTILNEDASSKAQRTTPNRSRAMHINGQGNAIKPVHKQPLSEDNCILNEDASSKGQRTTPNRSREMHINVERNAKLMQDHPHTNDSNGPIEDASPKGQRTTPNRPRAMYSNLEGNSKPLQKQLLSGDNSIVIEDASPKGQRTTPNRSRAMCGNGGGNAIPMQIRSPTEDTIIINEDVSSRGQNTTPNRLRAMQRIRESFEKAGFNLKEKYMTSSPHRQRENQTPTRPSRVLNFDQDVAEYDRTQHKHTNISANEGKCEQKTEKTKRPMGTSDAEREQSPRGQLKWVRKDEHTSNAWNSSGKETNRTGKDTQSSRADHKSKNFSDGNDFPVRASKDLIPLEDMSVKFLKSVSRQVSGADGAASMSSSPYQPPNLPFTHYISKLKKLVPNEEDASDTTSSNTSLRPLTTQMEKPSNGAKNEVGHSSEQSGVFSPSSSSGTFSESLTYSNPVFEDEVEFPEDNTKKPENSNSEEASQAHSGMTRSLERISEATEEVASSSTFSRDTRTNLSSKFGEKHREGSHRSPDVNQPLEFTLAGHKFQFPKEFFQGKVHVNIDDVEGLLGNALKHPDGGIYGSAAYDDCNRDKHPQFVDNLTDCVDVRDDVFSSETQHPHVSDAAWMADPSHGFCTKVSDETLFQEMATEGRRVKKTRKEMAKPATVRPRDSVNGEDEMKNVDRETWLRAKIIQLENDLKEQRSSSLTEMKTMKGYINTNVCSKLEELMGTLERTQKLLMEKENEKQSFEQGLNVKVELCKNKCESIKEQMDCFLKEFKTSLTKEMMNKASMDFQDMRDLCKGQMEAVQVGISNTINNLKCELTSSIDEVRQHAEANIDRNSLENSIVKKLKSKGSVLHADRDSIDEIRSELQSVWKEIHQLSEDKMELKDKIGQLTDAVSIATESFSKEHNSIKSDNINIKKQLQHLKKKNVKTKEETREIQREVVSAMQTLQSTLTNMKGDGALVQNDTEILQKLEERFTSEKVSMENQYEKVKKEEEVLKEEVEMLKTFREEVLKHGVGSWNGDKDMVMESLDRLSHFYLGALDEVREEVLQMKLTGKCWIDEMECKWEHVLQMQNDNPLSTDLSVHNIMLDSLDSRISHVEQVLEGSKEIHRAQQKVQGILATLAKDQECASAAATKAMACADKADEMLNNISETLTEAFETSKLNTMKLQESLESDLETVVQACAEIKRINCEILQEKEMAIAAVSESKRRSYEIWECLQKDMVNLRNSLFLIEKDKEAASLAANKAIETANKAEEVLEAISKKYQERLASHCDAMTEKVEEFTYKGQTESQLHADMSDRIQDLLIAIEEVGQKTSQLDEEHKKQGLVLHDLSIQVTATSEAQVNIIHNVSDVSKKVETMETNMVTLTHDIETVRTVTEEMEKASMRHESAVSLVLEELEKRSNHLELPADRKSFQDNINQLDRQVLGPTEKEDLMSLYEEMSSFFNKLRQVHGQEEDTPQSEETSKEIQVAINKLETKLVGLEDMVKQMESTSSCSSRMLDSKLNIFNSQIQTAVKIAATAEGKCNALGAELVKLFRLLASSKKKRMLAEKPETVTPERKCPRNDRCLSQESTLDQSVRSLEGIFKPDSNEARTFSLSNVDQQQASQEGESTEKKTIQSEGKMLITSVGRKRTGRGKPQVHVSSNQSEQDPANRIFVNVCHRSAIVSGNRLVMKEGTFTVKSAAC